MKYLSLLLALYSFDASAYFSMNVCSEKDGINRISNLYSMSITSVDKTLSSIIISVPDKIEDKYEFSKIYFVVSRYEQTLLSGDLQTDHLNNQHSTYLIIRKGMIKNAKIYVRYNDQLGKVLFDTNYCEIELKES